jgi:hypothetical protein
VSHDFLHLTPGPSPGREGVAVHRVSAISMRQPIKKTSRVPRYQNIKIIDGYCDYFFKPLPWRGQRGLGLRLRPLLIKKGVGMMEDGRVPPCKKRVMYGITLQKVWENLLKRLKSLAGWKILPTFARLKTRQRA